ncbi:hypothetical protein [Erythrobacter colymbi]|nr:hypothetical protein [Erythrobacter colymbi]
MTDPDLITILHLSDFHYATRKAREQEIVVDALLECPSSEHLAQVAA